MNYFLLALALIAALVALLYTANIVRVALGRITWANNAAFAAHILIAPIAIVTAVWLFRTAVGA